MTMIRNVTARHGDFLHGIAAPRSQLTRQGQPLGDTDRQFNDRLTIMLVHADPEELRGGHVGTDMKYDCCVGVALREFLMNGGNVFLSPRVGRYSVYLSTGMGPEGGDGIIPPCFCISLYDTVLNSRRRLAPGNLTSQDWRGSRTSGVPSCASHGRRPWC